jgi:hypothetical protein
MAADTYLALGFDGMKLTSLCVCVCVCVGACSTATSYTPSSSAPASLNSPLSMPNSHSSFIGMPSRSNPHVPNHGGLGPGWSEQAAPAERSPNSAKPDIKPEGRQVKGDKLKGNNKGKKKGGWLCCLRPRFDDDDVPVAPTSIGSTCSGSVADELVRDGVPLGGVTSTSEDVIQIDSNTLVQCNVGLSVSDGPENDETQYQHQHHQVMSPGSSASMAGIPQPLSAGFDGIGKSYGGALTEANLAAHMPGSQGPRTKRAAPTSGT